MLCFLHMCRKQTYGCQGVTELGINWETVIDIYILLYIRGLPWWLSGKESTCQCRDMGLIPWLGRSPGEGNGNPLQYSWLENPMDMGAWWAIVQGVAKSWTWLSDFTFTFEHSLALPFFGAGMKTDLFQFCVFQICWPIECSTLTASSFRIWNS